MRTKSIMAKIAWAAGVFSLLLCLLAPVPVWAADSAVHDIDITVELNDDGSAVITEVWSLTASDDITEWYIEKINLDEQKISDMHVWENGVEFTNEGQWDVERTREQKAGKCGIVNRSDGYELCWGIGSAGNHVFTLQYTITNLVKGYADANAINQVFVVSGGSMVVEHIQVTIRKPGTTFREENTGVWAGGGSTVGEIGLVNGEIVAETTQAYTNSSAFGILVEFAPDMFSPLVHRDQTFADLRLEVLEGTQYDLDDYGNTSGGGFLSSDWFGAIAAVFFAAVFGVVFVALGKVASAHNAPPKSQHSLKEFKDAPYSRALPYHGSLPATYARLDELKQLDSDGVIIGAYLLQWIRSRQVQLVQQQAGLFGNKQEDAIQLFTARPEMAGIERQLYNMLVSASGSDYILQSKEFEKWSKKNYEKVQGWLESYKNKGKGDMRALGTTTQQETKVLGFIPLRQSVLTPVGEQLTMEMFGFKKYLEDFTIINERQAREVQLWDEYLVYAQVFGIADKVAEQFKALYPDYFVNMARDLGYSNVTWFDIYMINRLTRNYGTSMITGYRAGYNAAHSSSSSGGGGSFSGGGFSGSSGGGGSFGGR